MPEAPLHGVRVVEAGRFISAPLASMLLAQLGADVVKIEAPGGDPFRAWDQGAISPRFFAFNRGKRSIVLDLADPAGRRTLDALLAGADVFVHNFRPAAVRKLDLGWERLGTDHPRLIVCGITGAGMEGPLADRPSYDQIGQALSGFMSVLSGLEEPRALGPSLSDAASGMFAAQGILAALHARERTGRGCPVDVSMLQATVAFLCESGTHYLLTGEAPGPATRAAQSQSYAFRCADGETIVVHLSTPAKFWRALLEVVGRDELADDPRFADYGSRVRNSEALRDELAPAFARHRSGDLLTALEQADVPCSRVNSFADVFDGDRFPGMQLATEVDAGGQTVRSITGGVDMPGLPPHAAAPELGAHTEEILAALEPEPKQEVTDG